MYEVLVFVYENYWRGDACPEPEQLGRKLSAHGFAHEEIRDALQWLAGLNFATQDVLLEHSGDVSDAAMPGASDGSSFALASSAGALRVYAIAEQDHLGAACLGFLSFLDASGLMPAGMREIIIERAMAAPGEPVSLEEFKIIVLMVHWSSGIEPDALVLDELCVKASARIAH